MLMWGKVWFFRKNILKIMFEEILKWYDKIHGMKSICLRYFNVAGAGDGIGEEHEPETHVIPLLIQASISENEFKIFGDDYKTPDGSCIRDYVHVSDLADAHYKALNYLISKNESNQFNIGNVFLINRATPNINLFPLPGALPI